MKPSATSSFTALVLILAAGFGSALPAPALAAPAPAVVRDPVPNNAAPQIGGYSPVSYFTEGRAVPGRSEHAVAFQGRVYYLASAAQIDVFYENPKRYVPRYPVCPFSLTEGRQMAVDPTRFKVVGDSLLLFHASPGMDGLGAWNQSPLGEDELLRRADSQFVLLRF